VKRRLLLVALAALLLVALAWWLRDRDGRQLPTGWRPPRVSVGRDTRPSEATSGGDGPEWGVLSCTVDTTLGDDPGKLIARGEDGRAVTARVEDRTLSLELEPGDWTVTWHSGKGARPSELRRFGVVEVAAGEPQRCTIAPRGWTIAGEVRDLSGESLEGALVEGCGASTQSDETGRFSLVVSRGDCLVRAWSIDGMLRRPSEPIYFSPFDPPPPPTFRVDTAEIGGVGLGLSSTPKGLRVGLVVEGGPGGTAGVLTGDTIVAVDGALVRGWTVPKGVEAITGPPGTVVRLRVERDGQEQTYALVRERLDDAPGPTADTGTPPTPELPGP